MLYKYKAFIISKWVLSVITFQVCLNIMATKEHFLKLNLKRNLSFLGTNHKPPEKMFVHNFLFVSKMQNELWSFRENVALIKVIHNIENCPCVFSVRNCKQMSYFVFSSKGTSWACVAAVQVHLVKNSQRSQCESSSYADFHDSLPMFLWRLNGFPGQ